MNPPSPLSPLSNDEINAIYEAKHAAQAALDAAEKVCQEARLNLQAATKACQAVEYRERYASLTSEQQATLSGPCPQGPAAHWWERHGWAQKAERRYYMGVVRVTTGTMEWTEKAEAIRALLKEAKE